MWIHIVGCTTTPHRWGNLWEPIKLWNLEILTNTQRSGNVPKKDMAIYGHDIGKMMLWSIGIGSWTYFQTHCNRQLDPPEGSRCGWATSWHWVPAGSIPTSPAGQSKEVFHFFFQENPYSFPSFWMKPAKFYGFWDGFFGEFFLQRTPSGSAEQDLQTSGGSAEASQGTQAPLCFHRGHHGHRIFQGYPLVMSK